jgi:hypothetical protein
MPPFSRRRFVGGLAFLACGAAAQSAPHNSRESLVKASFLHRFASFVRWPEGSFQDAHSPLRIGVVGDDEVWSDLRELARDRDRDGRPVRVTRLNADDALAGHHVVYVRAASAEQVEALLARAPAGVLTVADVGGAHPRGSVLSFFVEDGRVRFGASPEAARRQRLRLSDRLLSIARTVRGGEPARDPAQLRT